MKTLLTMLLSISLTLLTGQEVVNQISYAPGYLTQSGNASHTINYQRTYQLSSKWYVGGDIGYTLGNREITPRHSNSSDFLFCGVGLEYIETQLKMIKIGHIAKYKALSTSKYDLLIQGGIGFAFTNMAFTNISLSEPVYQPTVYAFGEEIDKTNIYTYQADSRLFYQRWTVPSLGVEFVRKFAHFNLSIAPNLEILGEKRTNTSLRFGIQW